jgi:hypothetical protein
LPLFHDFHGIIFEYPDRQFGDKAEGEELANRANVTFHTKSG